MLLHFFSVVHSVFLLSTILLCLYHSLFIHSPANGDSGCFQFDAVMINADVNMCAQIFV